VHADGQAGAFSRGLNADAVTSGNDIFFREGTYRPHSPSGHRLLAHELAHVVQQGDVPRASVPDRVSQPSDPAEHWAERAADAVMQGERVPQVHAAPAGYAYRVVHTNGGEWDTTRYAPRGAAVAVGDRFGADITLTFKPNELVEADNIGLTQTVNTLKSATAGGPVSTPSAVSARNAALSLTPAEGDTGRAVDQGDPSGGDTVPNTSPLYAVEASAGSVPATLTDVGATAGFGQHGFRKKKADGTFDVQNASLLDGPTRGLEFVGQQWTQKFEATALVLDGPMANTYLGSVAWGWKTDAAGAIALDPNPIAIVRSGAPAQQFMDAARKWNAATFTDPTTGTVHDTVDLPATTMESGVKAAVDMTTLELITSLANVNSQIFVLSIVSGSSPAGAVGAKNDTTNKEFEKRALEAELKKRRAKINVKVNSTEDWIGSDNVYVKLIGPGGRVEKTSVTYLNDGESHDFLIPLEKLLPLDGPMQIKVYDEDTPDADDLIVEMEWSAPYNDTKNTRSYDDANYDVLATFEK
jgi:hypothetical protein